MARSEYIGTEIPTRDSVISRELDSRPPLRIDERPVVQPIPDESLASLGGNASVGSHASGESVLATTNVDRPLQGRDMGKVVSLHERQSTTILVTVNKKPGLEQPRGLGTVLNMPTTKRKPQVARSATPGRKRVKQLDVGPDGLTMPQRLQRLMLDADVGQSELARMASMVYASFVPADEEKVKQQHIFNILQGQDTSWCLPLIAKVFDVNDMWLQFGVGPKERKKN